MGDGDKGSSVITLVLVLSKRQIQIEQKQTRMTTSYHLKPSRLFLSEQYPDHRTGQEHLSGRTGWAPVMKNDYEDYQ